MEHNTSNYQAFNDGDPGTLMKQDSVHDPTPMTPTQNSHRTFLSTEPQNHSNTSHMKRNVSYGNLGYQSEAKVLVLYTGGTIGMLRNHNNGGYTST